MFSQILVSLLTTCRGGYKIHCALGETWKPCIFTLASTVASTTTVTFVLTYARFILQLPLFFFSFYLIHQNSSVMQEHHAQSPVTVSHAIKWYTFSFNFASLLMPIDSYTSFKAQSPKHTQTKKKKSAAYRAVVTHCCVLGS